MGAWTFFKTCFLIIKVICKIKSQKVSKLTHNPSIQGYPLSTFGVSFYPFLSCVCVSPSGIYNNLESYFM